MTNEKEVKKYMKEEVEDHRDPKTGELNSTTLAEDACMHFDDYGPEPDVAIPDEYFEWAFEVCEDNEKPDHSHFTEGESRCMN